ncbi:MAG: SUMF1/EgtB/PvdO family nonheme iron enzyme [Gemmataceae bacterium]
MTINTASWLGQTLADGRYQVRTKLGEGGMSLVFLAEDCLTHDEVVLKVPRPAILDTPDFAGRFTREVRSLLTLVHPHIVKVLDLGEHEGIPFVVLQYLSGGSLRDRLLRDANGQTIPLAPDELVAWLPDVAQSLDFIHGQQCIHRDVKPDNILFGADGQAYLSDFGIAKVLDDDRPQELHTICTTGGQVLGTPYYMAPELIIGEPFDRRVDQYGLAVTLFEVLSGRLPFDGPNPTAIYMQQVNQEPPVLHELLPTIPKTISQAVRKGMAKNPAERFASCEDLAWAVLQSLRTIDKQPIAVPPPPEPPEVPAAPLILQCAKCRKRFRVRRSPPGKTWHCPQCKHLLKPVLSSTNNPPVDEWDPATEPMTSVGDSKPPLRSKKPPSTTVEMPPPIPRVHAWLRPTRQMAAWIGGAGGLAVVLLLLAVWFLGPGGHFGQGPPASPATNASQPSPTPFKRATLPLPRELVNSIGMKLVLIPQGEFRMGSPPEEPGRVGDEVLHDVVISRPFLLGIHEVTQTQYQTVLDRNPSSFSAEGMGRDKVQDLDTRDFPVERVSWHDAVEFCRRLSDLPDEARAGRVYRLPTEAEWEYACRAGGKAASRFHFGNMLTPNQANIASSKGRTEKVGSHPPNAFGLHDMHGNVWEWCADYYGSYGGQRQVDPRGPEEGSDRVMRGGSWFNDPPECRSATRLYSSPTNRGNDLGFRVACDLIR